MSCPREERLQEILACPPPPSWLPRVCSVEQGGRLSTDELVEIVEADQGLHRSTLAVMVSPLFGGAPLASMAEAVVRLGFHVAARIVVHAGVLSTLPGEDAPGLRLHHHLWKTALAARLVALRTGAVFADEAALAGLCHDVGKLVLKRLDPPAFAEVAREAGATGRWALPEWDHFGVEHTEAGQAFLGSWGIPGPFGAVARHHHATELFDNSEIGRTRREIAGLDAATARLVAATHLADEITHRVSGAPWTRGHSLPVHQLRAGRYLGINAREGSELVAEIGEAVAALPEPPSG